jgi:hypothetical protein
MISPRLFMIPGDMCVRACESEPGVRLPALRCTQSLLQLGLCYEGHLSPDEDLPPVFSDLSNESPTDISSLSYIVCAKLPYAVLGDYTRSLVEGLQDPHGGEGTAKMLNLVAESKGAELYHHVGDLLGELGCYYFRVSTRLENREKSGNSVETGRVREFHKKLTTKEEKDFFANNKVGI